jgi:hypothetical protein
LTTLLFKWKGEPFPPIVVDYTLRILTIERLLMKTVTLTNIQVRTLLHLLKFDDKVIVEDRKELDNSETLRQLKHNQEITDILIGE